MRKIDRIKTLPWICMIIITLTLSGCADDTAHDSEEVTQQTQMPRQESEDNYQKKQDVPPQAAEAVTDVAAEAETEEKSQAGVEAETKNEDGAENQADAENETKWITDPYEPVPVTQLDYDSFQSRMTKEEWESFQQYIPVLKENAAFELTRFEYDNYTRLDKDGEVTEEEESAVFLVYDYREMTDLSGYLKVYADRGITDPDEMMIYEVQVFDLDGDGIQELILYWGYAWDVLVLHRENEKFYGWETVYRGFEILQTSGAYVASGGALCNDWRRIRFDQGTWIAEVLASIEGDKYFIGGEEADETAYQQQSAAYETGKVTSYRP